MQSTSQQLDPDKPAANTMPNTQAGRNLDRGRWGFAGDRTDEQASFLEAIRERAPHVLRDLYERVFPLFQEEYARKLRYWERYGGLSYLRECHAHLLATAPRDAFWSSTWQYDLDPPTWPSVWDWAGRANLTRGMDLEKLKTRRGLYLFRYWFDSRPHDMYESSLRKLGFSFRVSRPPEVTFGLPLCQFVWRTLEHWALWSPNSDDLHLALPGPQKVSHEPLRADTSEKSRDINWELRQYREALAPEPEWTYVFRACGWDVFSGETRAEAKRAIMTELEKQLEQKLDETARKASTKPYLQKLQEKREEEHYGLLVLYQVEGLSYADVTRKIYACPRGPRASGDQSHKDPDNFRSNKAAVTFGIKSAAECLIGPCFTGWLRPGQRGRRRRSS
jgi:hypothetical protein